jgi:hypothetical protein
MYLQRSGEWYYGHPEFAMLERLVLGMTASFRGALA